MPFQSKSQLRACFALKARLEKEGKTSKWNCHEFYHAEGAKPFKNLPDYKYEDAKIHVGPKGGRYILKNNRKIYLRS
jgi:hypothetical protein